jgi:predicted LPLAT superfamily acyltransferase
MADDPKVEWAQEMESGSARQLRLMRWLALHAPTALTNTLLWSISLVYAIQTNLPSTRASCVYLQRVLKKAPGLRERHIHALTFAHVFLDRARLLSKGLDEFQIDAEGQELIEGQFKTGRGGVLLGAHFGSFEAMRAFDSTLPELRVRYLMFPDHAPTSTALLNELNTETASRVISLANGPQAMLEVHHALDKGDFVAFLGDRQPGKTPRSQLTVPFLGGSINVPTSPYIAAIAAGVPLYLCVAPRLGKNRYAISFYELYDGSRIPRAERKDRIAGLAHAFASHLEDLCHRHPYNWFNFYDIWSEPDPLPRNGSR